MNQHKDSFCVSFGNLKMDCKPEECRECIFRNKCSKRIHTITSVEEGIKELIEGGNDDK